MKILMETLIAGTADQLCRQAIDMFNPILDGVRAYPILDGGGGKKAPQVNSTI